MATNDGYSPYPLGLSAADASAAIRRAYYLDDELAGFVRYTNADTAPSVINTMTGDLWYSTTLNKLFRAEVEGTTLIWFEV